MTYPGRPKPTPEQQVALDAVRRAAEARRQAERDLIDALVVAHRDHGRPLRELGDICGLSCMTVRARIAQGLASTY